jgi:hypothetical protein
MPPLWIFAIVFSVLAVVVPPFAPLLGGAVTTLTVHLAVLVLAPKRKSIGYTFRTVLYSYGTNAILAVPICGAYAGGIWQIVTLVVGVREVHETSTGRAVLAVLWPIVVIVPLYLAAVLSMVFMVGQ